MGCSAAAMPGTGLRACWKHSRFGKIHNTADLERYTSFCFVLFCSSPFPQPHCKTWSSIVCISHNLEEELSMFTASFCSASSYWRTRFCPRSCSEKFSTWDAEFCAIKHPCLPPAQWGLRTQLSLALAHGSPVHTSSPLHTSCPRCLVLTKHRPVLLLPLLSAWFGVSELKKKVSLPKKQVTKW